MKPMRIALLVTLSCALAAHAQTAAGRQAVAGAVAKTDVKEQLQLTTGIVNLVSCSPAHASFTLRLTFKNVGREPIILDKRSFIAGILVSRDVESAAAARYETYLRYSMFGGDKPGFGLTPPADLSGFHVLRAGESHEFEDRVFIPTTDVTVHAEGPRLRPGTHFLQVQAVTWSYVADSAPFRKKWRGQGLLWSQGLTSLPMPFTIEKDCPVPKSPSGQAIK